MWRHCTHRGSSRRPGTADKPPPTPPENTAHVAHVLPAGGCRDPLFRGTWPKARSRVAAAWSLLFFADVTCVGCCLLLPLQPQKKVDIVLRVPCIAPRTCVPWTEPQGAQLQAQACGNPQKVQVGGSRCVPKSEASAGCPRTGCSGHTCKLLSSHEG